MSASKKMFPTMYEHECSEGCPGGFFKRVKEGTWMGHVVEHIALEIQTLAGMDVGFGRTRSTSEHGVYNVVFAYMEEKVGIYAAKAAVRIVQALVDDEIYDLEDDIQTVVKFVKMSAWVPFLVLSFKKPQLVEFHGFDSIVIL